MSKLTRKELGSALSEETKGGLSNETIDTVLSALSNVITKSVQNGDQVVLPNIGMFEKRERPARKGRNPQTGAEIQIAASNVCGFKPVKALKDALNS